MDPAELRPGPILLILLMLSLLTYISAPVDKSSRPQGYAARRLPPAMTVSNLRKVRNSATPQLHIPPPISRGDSFADQWDRASGVEKGFLI